MANEWAGGFGAGFAPGLAQSGNLLAMIPYIRQQRAEREDKLAQQRVQTLLEVLKLPQDIGGPYLDLIVEQLGVDPTIAKMIKQSRGERREDLHTILNDAGVKNPREIGRILGGGSTGDVMKFLGDFYKTKREQEQADKFAGLVPGLSGPATPPGYSFERADVPPPAPPPPQAPPLPPGPEPLVGPAEAPPAAPMTGTGALGGVTPPPAAAPRPAPIDLRPPMGATEALRDVHQRRLDMYQADMRRLGEFTRAVAQMSGGGIPEAQQRFIGSERQRIEAEHKPFLESLGKRLDTETAAAAKAKEPLTEPSKLFADRARALAAGRTREVIALDAQIDSLGAKTITEFDGRVRGLMPGKTLLTMGERDWPIYDERAEAQRTREAAAIGAQGAKTRLETPEKAATAEREKLIADVGNIKQVARFQSMYNPAFVGPVRAQISTAKEKTGLGTMLPGEADFDSALARYTNAVISLLSGANVPAQEFTRMEAELPRKNHPPEVFEARMRQTEINVHEAAQDRRAIYAGTGVSLTGIPPLPESSRARKDREILERLRKPKGSP